MTKEEHRERHIMLHKALDELVADFIANTKNLPSKTNIMQFLNWSHKQTIDPHDLQEIKP